MYCIGISDDQDGVIVLLWSSSIQENENAQGIVPDKWKWRQNPVDWYLCSDFQVAQKFYTLLVLKKHVVLELHQESSYDDIMITRGAKFDNPSL